MKYITSFLLLLACLNIDSKGVAFEVNSGKSLTVAEQPKNNNAIAKSIAMQHGCKKTSCCARLHHYGNSAFSVSDPNLWYTITTQSYPSTTPLSFNSNFGESVGKTFPSPTGFTVGESGNYWVQMTAIMQNPGTDTILIPVFLIRDETFDPAEKDILGSIVALQPQVPTAINESGVLMNIKAGTRLSIVATNAGYPDPIPVQVVAWKISLFKLP